MAGIDLLWDFVLAAGGAFGGGLIVLAGERLIAWWHQPVLVPSVDTTQHRATGCKGASERRGRSRNCDYALGNRPSTGRGNGRPAVPQRARRPFVPGVP
jgi:hypothetical protein